MGIFDELENGISDLRKQVTKFKTDHTKISRSVSDIVDSLPFPFNAFGKLLWNGLDQKEESAELVLKTLQNMALNEDIAFMEITLHIKDLLNSSPSSEDILQVSKQIRESEQSVIDILGTKIDNLGKYVKYRFDRIERLLTEGIQNREPISDEFQPLEIEQNKSEDINLEIRLGEFHSYAKEHEIDIAHYDTVLDYNKQNTAALNNKGNSLHKLHRYEDAISCYDEAIRINSNLPNAFYNKGNSLHKLHRYEDAISCYDEAIRLNPNFVDAFFNKGNVLRDDLGRYEEAISCYDEAIRRDPNLAAAYSNKGLSLHDLQKYEEAISCYDEAIRLNPNSAIIFSNKGLSLASIYKYEEAISCYDEAIRRDPKNAIAFNNKGISLQNLHRYEDAISCYDEAIRLNPKIEDLFSNKAFSLHNLQKYDDAVNCYDIAIQINPNKAITFYNKGTVLHQDLGKYKEAISCYDEAIRLNPDHMKSFYNKSCCYALMGDIDDSLEFLKRAISLNSICKKFAIDDKDFLKIKNDDRFKKLVHF